MDVIDKIVLSKEAPEAHNVLWVDTSQDKLYTFKWVIDHWEPVWRKHFHLVEDIDQHKNVTCFDGGDGSITVEASGGQTPYEYSLDANFTNVQDNGTFNNLSITGPIEEGTDQYGGILICTKRIYVRDANGKIAFIDVQLKSPVELAWENCPDNIVVCCDPGQNYATVIIGTGDGVNVVEPNLSTTANGAGEYIEHSTYLNQYPIGYNEIHYTTFNDCDEWPDDCSFTITVLPNE